MYSIVAVNVSDYHSTIGRCFAMKVRCIFQNLLQFDVHDAKQK